MLRREWEAWKRQNDKGGRYRATVDIVYENFKNVGGQFDETWLLLVLQYEGTEFPFMLGIDDEGQLNSEFSADYSGNCDTPMYCQWAKEMGYYVGQHWDDEQGLTNILTEAVRLYHHLLAHPEEYKARLITNKKPIPALSIVTELRSNPRVKISPITNQKWDLVVSAQYAKITAYARTYSSSSGFYCDLRVFSPRLAIGRNVNFGGAVTGEGLTKESPSRSIRHLIDAILLVLDDEVPFTNSSYDYTDEEYEASIMKKSIPAQYVSKFKIQLSVLPIRDNSVVVISTYNFDRLIGDGETLWLKIRNDLLDREVWAMAHPSTTTMSNDELRVSDTLLANVDCDPGDQLMVFTGQLPNPDASGVSIRLRGVKEDVDIVHPYIEAMSSLTVGATYYHSGAYFDILHAGSKGACSLRVVGNIAVTYSDMPSLIAPPVQLDPLAVEYEEYDEEEYSD